MMVMFLSTYFYFEEQKPEHGLIPLIRSNRVKINSTRGDMIFETRSLQSNVSQVWKKTVCSRRERESEFNIGPRTSDKAEQSEQKLKTSDAVHADLNDQIRTFCMHLTDSGQKRHNAHISLLKEYKHMRKSKVIVSPS